MTPEFAELVFKGGQSLTFGLTPLMAYFVIYLAFLDKYSEEDEKVSLISSIKEIIPYSVLIGAIWIMLLIVIYVIGIPIGIKTAPTL